MYKNYIKMKKGWFNPKNEEGMGQPYIKMRKEWVKPI
jgi:hypothetical protein